MLLLVFIYGNYPNDSDSDFSTRLTLYIKTGEEDSGISAGEIAASEDKSSIYGATVKGYECTNSAAVNNWKIFYADDSNIYLIADDYIPYEYIPASSAGNKPNQGSYSRSAYFPNIINDYAGATSITDERIKALNNDYFTKGYTSLPTASERAWKSVAYMLDTNAWSVYAGDKAEYGIGGPTFELLFKSYNEKYGVDYRAQVTNYNILYEISNDGGLSWTDRIDNMLNSSDTLYVLPSGGKAYSTWIASPSRNTGLGVISNTGTVEMGYFAAGSGGSEEPGFRPIVCLKSDVKLQDNGDGTYTIK